MSQYGIVNYLRMNLLLFFTIDFTARKGAIGTLTYKVTYGVLKYFYVDEELKIVFMCVSIDVCMRNVFYPFSSTHKHIRTYAQ